MGKLHVLIGIVGLVALAAGCSSVDDTCPQAQVFDDAGQCVLPCVLEDCGDGNECTVDDCNNLGDGTAECANPPKEDDTACTQGENTGWCVSGACDLCAKVDCDDSNDCTVDGECDPTTGGCPDETSEPTGTPCGDGGVCDGRGVCGACTENAQCSDANECTQDVCTSGGTCTYPPTDQGSSCTDEGEYCDGAGVCVECVDNSPCDDGNPCTSNICTNDSCEYPNNDGAPCDLTGQGDGQCSGGECMDPGAACQPTNPCDDDKECTQNVCTSLSPTQHECSFPPQSADVDCGDGWVCDGSGDCVKCTENTQNTQCFDGNQCTHDTCIGGTCPNLPTDRGISFCSVDNKTYCDGTGVCVECVDNSACDDGNPCTRNLCTNDSCEYPNNDGAPCDLTGQGDGQCSGGECMDPGAACQPANPCDDDKECTQNVCTSLSPTQHECSFPPQSADVDCGDGWVCDGSGDCVKCTENTQNTQCFDGNQCTHDTCIGGTCPNLPTDRGISFCSVDNKTYCDGTGVCVECVDNSACDDGNPCTSNICTNDSCESSDRDDGAECGDGAVACSAGVCVPDELYRDNPLNYYQENPGPLAEPYELDHMWGLAGFYLNFLDTSIGYRINEALAGYFPAPGATMLYARISDSTWNAPQSGSVFVQKLPLGSSVPNRYDGNSPGGCVNNETIGELPPDMVPVLRGFRLYRATEPTVIVTTIETISVRLVEDRINDQVDLNVCFQGNDLNDRYSFVISYALVPIHRVVARHYFEGSATEEAIVPSTDIDIERPILQGFWLEYHDRNAYPVDQLSVQVLNTWTPPPTPKCQSCLRIRFNGGTTDHTFDYRVFAAELK